MEKVQATVKNLAVEGKKNAKIGFSVEYEQVSEHPDVIMSLRKHDYVMINAIKEQSNIGQDGAVVFPEIKFKSEHTSITLTVLDKGIHATLTFTTKDKELFDHIVQHKLLNQKITLEFEPGAKLEGEENPDAYDKPTCSKCGENDVDDGSEFCKPCTDAE